MSEFSNPNLEVLISSEEIQQRIKQLGAEVARDYAGLNPLLIGVLKGACIFLSDLMRAAEIPLGGPGDYRPLQFRAAEPATIADFIEIEAPSMSVDGLYARIYATLVAGADC